MKKTQVTDEAIEQLSEMNSQPSKRAKVEEEADPRSIFTPIQNRGAMTESKLDKLRNEV